MMIRIVLDWCFLSWFLLRWNILWAWYVDISSFLLLFADGWIHRELSFDSSVILKSNQYLWSIKSSAILLIHRSSLSLPYLYFYHAACNKASAYCLHLQIIFVVRDSAQRSDYFLWSIWFSSLKYKPRYPVICCSLSIINEIRKKTAENTCCIMWLLLACEGPRNSRYLVCLEIIDSERMFRFVISQ